MTNEIALQIVERVSYPFSYALTFVLGALAVLLVVRWILRALNPPLQHDDHVRCREWAKKFPNSGA